MLLGLRAVKKWVRFLSKTYCITLIHNCRDRDTSPDPPVVHREDIVEALAFTHLEKLQRSGMILQRGERGEYRISYRGYEVLNTVAELFGKLE